MIIYNQQQLQRGHHHGHPGRARRGPYTVQNQKRVEHANDCHSHRSHHEASEILTHRQSRQ